MTIRIILISFFLILILNSCKFLNHTAYFASPPNVNCFNSEKEKNLKLSLSLNHNETQSNIAFGKNIGVSAGLYGGFHGQYGGEIASLLYNKFNDNKYFETQIGYGYFNNKTKYAGNEFMSYDFWFTIAPAHNIYTKYHKIFIQPTYFYKTKHINYGITIKLNAVYFTQYHYYYKKLTDWTNREEDPYFKTYTTSTLDFTDKWNIVCEPVLTFQFFDNINLQLSGIISNINYESPKYSEEYRSRHSGPFELISTKEIGTTRLRQHVSILFTIGYTFKLKKKK